MAIYNNNQTIAGMDDVANATLLRVDLHLVFDEPKFTFVPKGVGDNAQLAVHLLDTSEELVDLYHNRPITLPLISIEMLYARLAWAIFQRLGSFLRAHAKRRLALAVSRSKADSRGFVSPSNCIILAGLASSRARSKSPKKRRPPSPHYSDECKAIHTNHHRKRRRITATPKPQSDSPRLSYSQPAEPSLTRDSHSPSSFQSTTSSPRSQTRLQNHFDLLRSQALEEERNCSDKSHLFAEEAAFACQVWAGRAISGNEVARFYNACGVEFPESLDDV